MGGTLVNDSQFSIAVHELLRARNEGASNYLPIQKTGRLTQANCAERGAYLRGIEIHAF